MKTRTNFDPAAGRNVRPARNLPPSKKVLLEVLTGSEHRQYVVSYSEWLLIEEWYKGGDSDEPYILEPEFPDDAHTVVRLDNKVSEIRVYPLTPAALMAKNIKYVLYSQIPGFLKITVAFLLSVLLWIAMLVYTVIKDIDKLKEIVVPATQRTYLVFLAFLLFNLLFITFKVLEVVRDKYRAFTGEQDVFLTDTFLFNFISLFAVMAIGPQRIIDFLISIFK